MKTTYTLFITLALSAIAWSQTQVSGPVSGRWTSRDAPYILSADVEVESGDSLLIDSGVLVDLGGSFSFRVAGTLVARSVRFEHGGEVFSTGGSVTLEACEVVGTTAGIRAFGGTLFMANCWVDSTAETGVTFSGTDSSYIMDSHVLHSGDYGIKVRNTADVIVQGNTLAGNSQNDLSHPALFIDSASPQSILGNRIVDNQAQGIGVWSLSSTAAPHIEGNLVKGNFTGITLVASPAYLLNNIIVANFQTGNINSGAGVYAGYAESTPTLMENYIGGNYYGVSNINQAACNLGDMVNDYPGDDGMNIFFNNRVSGEVWNIWNSTTNTLMAENNYWPGLTLQDVDATLYDNEEGGGTIQYETVYAEPLPVLMDVTGDDLINILDVVQAVDLVVNRGIPSAQAYFLADANGDFDLTIQDVLAIIEAITTN